MGIFSKSNTAKVHTLILEQIKDVEGCLVSFSNFTKAAVDHGTSIETLRALAESVYQMEGAADRSLRAMIESLNNVAYLPATRSELIDVASKCDKIANKCEHVAEMMVLQKFRFPKEYTEEILKIMAITQKEFSVLVTAIGKLFSRFDELLKDHAILDEIRDLESEVDEIEMDLYERIYAQKNDLAERMQLANFVELVCDVSDIIEDIADRIQIMLITRKA
ncbi:MAG: TIGR00153 family protein [Lachnospiraceae bacterium]|nr:TIGR00153 family protein [Lachnospiraceae bacterium]